MVVLVVGANGQLGARCAAELTVRGHAVRGSVRVLARGEGLARVGVEVVQGDLVSPDGLRKALVGVDTVLLTANPVAPRAGDQPATVYAGLLRLVDDAATAGVRRVVFVSIRPPPLAGAAPLPPHGREREDRRRWAGYEHLLLRFPP